MINQLEKRRPQQHIGERDWGRFTERYGIPPVDAVMAPGATEEQRAEYLEAVEAAMRSLEAGNDCSIS